MIIRIVGNNLGGGARKHVYILNKYMKNCGIDVLTFIPKAPFLDKFSDAELVEFDVVNSISVLSIIKYGLRVRDKGFFWLHLRNVAIIWGLFCWFFRIPFVITVHAPNLELNLREKIIRWVYGFVLKRADRVIFVSGFLKRKVLSDLGIMHDLGAVVWNGSELSSDEVRVNKAYRPNGVIRISIVGELTPRKGILELGLLYKKLNQLESEHKIVLDIYGEGPLKSEVLALQQESKSCGPVTVRYHGYTDSLEKMFGSSDYHLSLSFKEAFGRVVTEAAAFGVPTIARSSGAYPELISNNHNGFLFDNVEECSRLILHLLIATDEEYKCMSSVVTNWYKENFTGEIFCSNTISEVECLL